MMHLHDQELPPELQALDAELRGISIDERPSFGPELRAELEAAYAHGWRAPRPRSPGRMVGIAATVAIAVAGVSVPSARAALVGLYGVVHSRLATPSAAATGPLTPVARNSELTAQTEPAFVPLPASTRSDDGGEPPVWSSDLTDLVPNDAYPTLLDMDGVEEMVRWFYPDRLEHAGIGGVVRLILWVKEDGSVAERQIASPSGVPELDRAALQAAEHFLFQPARRRGEPVGTWVEFDVNFRARERDRR